MSVLRIVAIALLIVFSGGGIVAMLRSLLRRATQAEPGGAGIAGMGATVLGIGLFLLLWYGFAFTEPPNDFMRALKAGDDRAAFGLLTESLQSELGGYEGFTVWAEDIRPQRWFFMQSCSGGGIGRSDGTGRLMSGERFNVSFSLRRDDDRQWRIQGMMFWDLGAAYRVGVPSYLDCSD